MINRIDLIRNVTQFDSVQPPIGVDFKKLTLIYAENGRGKTSLSAIFRSLSSGEPVPIQERSRLGSPHGPHVVIQSDILNGQFVFQNNSWNHTYPLISVFDDVFVADNVYSGLEVQANHKQNLHEFILGSRGVALARRVDELTTQIAELNGQISQSGSRITTALRGHLTVDQFCELAAHPNIDQEIEEVERQIAALSHAREIADIATFQQFALPAFNLEHIQIILSSSLENIDQTALSRVTEHFTQIGERGEQWVAEGINREIRPAGASTANCPYCAQNLGGSVIVRHYRSYFSQEYSNLKRTISDTHRSLSSTLSGDSLAGFLHQIQDIQAKIRFWNQFCHVPELNLDLHTIQASWQNARDSLVDVLETKRSSPLERLELTDVILDAVTQYLQFVAHVTSLNQQFQDANNDILQVKRNTSQADLAALNTRLNELRITQTRFQADENRLCETYLRYKQEKVCLEELKIQARTNLDNYRAAAFPTFQAHINNYLGRFNAGFEIVNVQPSNAAGRPSSIYKIRINNTDVSLTGVAGTPSFRNTLSSGDRNSLTLAFFLASLDQEPDLANKIVFLDDVVTSLDEHRKLVTAEEIGRLLQKVSQVVVLSHNKSFLCEIWNTLHSPDVSTLQITRAQNGSSITFWDPTTDSVTQQDRSIATLIEYRDNNQGDLRQVAETIRYALEGYIRAKFPNHFPPGSLLGTFVNLSVHRIDQATAILNRDRTEELAQLIDYANRFHHDTNHNWRNELPTDGELLGFVRRTLSFIQG